MVKTPQFFKVILQETIQEGKLGIPKKFARRYGNYLSERVCLKVPTGAEWQVELVKSGVDIWFGNGWQQFVDYYSLSLGSFLVFRLENFKNCTFNVLIFDETTSEIDYPFNVHGHDEEQVLHHQPIKQENNDVDVFPTRISEDKSRLPFSRPCKKTKQENCRKQSEYELHQPITPKSIQIDVSRPRKLEEKPMSPFSRPEKKMKQEIGTGLSQAKKGNKGRVEIKEEIIEIEASPTRKQVEESTTVPFSRPCKKMKLENETGLHYVKRGKRDSLLKRAQAMSPKERANALNRAKRYYKPNNLSFSVVIQPTFVRRGFRANLPKCANKYFKEQRGSIILNSVDEKT